MQRVELKVHNSVENKGYAEISQSQSTKQALARRVGENAYERITGFVKCRDFLVDSYAFAKENKDFSIYGFSFKGSQMQPDWSGVYVVHLFANKDDRENFLRNLGYINAIEHANGLPITVVKDAGGNELLTEGDKFWLKSSLYLSLYTFLLRVACYKDYSKSKEPNVGEWLVEFGKQQFSDSKYAASVAIKTWDKVLGNLKLIETPTFCGFDPKHEGVSKIHHNSGFISVFGSHSEINQQSVRENSHWKLMQERGLETHTKAA